MSDGLYRIEHETRYVHSGGVSTSQHVAYLTPRTLPRQCVRRHELVIEPAPASRVQRIDYFGNAVDQFTILTPYDELRVVGRSVVEVIATESPIVLDAGASWEAVRDELFFQRGAPYADASEFSYPSPYAVTAPELAAFARDSFAPQRPLVAAAVHLMHRIHEEFTFDPGSTTIVTTRFTSASAWRRRRRTTRRRQRLALSLRWTNVVPLIGSDDCRCGGLTTSACSSGVSLPNYYRAAPLAPHRASVRGGDPALSRPENRGRRLVVASTPSADTVH